MQGCGWKRREELFVRMWSRKEAIAKAAGTGLLFPLHQLDVSVVPVRLGALETGGVLTGAYWVWDVGIGDRYACACSIKGEGDFPVVEVFNGECGWSQSMFGIGELTE